MSISYENQENSASEKYISIERCPDDEGLNYVSLHKDEIPISDLHHTFSPDLACEYGLECAVLIHHFQYWIRHNAAQGINFYDGKTWTYQTYEQICAYFPYWSIDQVKRILKKLTDHEILIKGNYNKNPYDQTVWYAFKNEGRYTILRERRRNRPIEKTKSPDQKGEIARPIPDSKTNSKTNLSLTGESARGKKIISQKHIKRENDIVFGQFVCLTQEEHSKLFMEYGKEITQDYIDSVNYHCNEEKPQGYKDYYLTILEWIRRDKKRGTYGKIKSGNQTPSPFRPKCAKKGSYINGVRIDD